MSQALKELQRKAAKARIMLERGEWTDQQAWQYALSELPEHFRELLFGGVK